MDSNNMSVQQILAGAYFSHSDPYIDLRYRGYRLAAKDPFNCVGDFYVGLLAELTSTPINVLVVGEVGAGKSSTINALLGTEAASVGRTTDAETKEIARYDLGGVALWDTPGLGNGRRQDEATAAAITKRLKETADDGAPLIDIVLLVIDGSAKNISTAYDILDVVMPDLGPDAERRLIVAVNKADVSADAALGAGKVRNIMVQGMITSIGDILDSDERTKKAKELLITHFNSLAASVADRLRENADIETDPFCIMASPFANDKEWRPYNVVELYRRIVMHNIAGTRVAARASGGR